MDTPSEFAPGQRVRYIHIEAAAAGAWKVRFGCCDTPHTLTEVQIRRVRNNLADQCNACRIASVRAQPIKRRSA